jgi:hypothetical protein
MRSPGRPPGDLLGPPPYERRLTERPGDRAEFDDCVFWLAWRSRPGRGYRVPPWASPARRRQARASWERIVRGHMGRVYELGRRQ